MERVILVRKVADAWVVGRDGQDFQRFGSKASAMERARALIDRLGDAELVVEEDACPPGVIERDRRPIDTCGSR